MSPTAELPVVLVAIRRDRSLMRTLGPNGYTVIESPSGARALERARETRPDVIILDTELPDLTGLEACRLFRGEPHIGRNVPILMLTSGPPSPEQRVTALRAGVWDFLRYGSDSDEMSLKLETYIQAKRNIDATLAEGLFDPTTGLHSRPGLARRARELGALMARHHGALACVVFAVDGPPDPRAANLVAQTARVCDVVGSLGPGEFAVLAPGTSDTGALRFAQRVASALCASPGGSLEGTVTPGIRVGYDAVVNLKYAPIDPVALLGRAAAAVRNGRPEPGYPWVRRFDAGTALDDARNARSTPPGLVLEDHGRGRQ
ncbi:MAG TPA: response regulator [Gemmatimonadales bacterium]|jgi:PleD family two-component response regulator|nr:response regulator [Gemmatimonadales bacterium]